MYLVSRFNGVTGTRFRYLLYFADKSASIGYEFVLNGCYPASLRVDEYLDFLVKSDVVYEEHHFVPLYVTLTAPYLAPELRAILRLESIEACMEC